MSGVRARRPLAAANWKMHLLRADAERYCAALRAGLPAAPAAEVVLFPSFPLLPPVAAALGGAPVAWGGQDLHAAEKGAHTGDVAGAQLADAGCTWVLCGHSERRRDHGEGDAAVAAKVAAAVRDGLQPLLCLGETREERHAGQTFAVLERQLREGLASRPERFAVAYEPVWAIGTGETATPELAAEAHAFLRGQLAALGFPAAAVRILYGGSVTPENAGELAAREEIDGFLVGGASLDPGRFLDIISRLGA